MQKGMRKCNHIALFSGEKRGATEESGGNLFALGAQQQRQRQAERQQRAIEAQRCSGGELLGMRLHSRNIAQRKEHFKLGPSVGLRKPVTDGAVTLERMRRGGHCARRLRVGQTLLSYGLNA